MDGISQYIDIILFAMVAGFLVFRLRSVLGRRTGNERRRPPPYLRPVETRPDTVVRMPELANAPAATRYPSRPGDAVADGLIHIKRADPNFEAAAFLAGARAAFEMIVAAFARGDKATLRPLLSDEVFATFAAAIDERNAAKETLETKIVRQENAEVADAALAGFSAQVTVKFVSEQINVTRAVDGSIVDGNPDQPVEKTDFWTFARDTRSSDPNWVLVATNSG